MAAKRPERDYGELGRITKKNSDEALEALRNELRRMSGRVVDKDHMPPDPRIIAERNQYSLDNSVILAELEEKWKSEKRLRKRRTTS